MSVKLEIVPQGPYDPQALGAECGECPLKGRQPVPPSWPARGKRPKFIIVGEAPGRFEVWKQRPFIGKSGMLLDRTLGAAKLKRYEALVTNSIACMPDGDRIDVKLAAASCCAPRLAREIEDASRGREEKPPILAMGNWGLRSVLGRAGILKCRGFVWETGPIDPKKIEEAKRGLAKLLGANEGKPSHSTLTRAGKKRKAIYLMEARGRFPGHLVIPTVHPAFILRGADGWMPVLIADMKRFGRLLDGSLVLDDEAPYDIAATGPEILKLLGKLQGDISLDIETAGILPLQDSMLCLALSDGDRTVVIYPWHRKLAPALRRAISGRVVVTHHGPQFDQIVLGREGVLD
jgi:uracil-DNA glycosylase family 4